MPRPSQLTFAAALIAAGSLAPAAWAQSDPPADEPPPAPPMAPAPAADVAVPDSAPAAPGSNARTVTPDAEAALRDAKEIEIPRVKALQTSVGLPPNALDLGSEADILGVRDSREMAAMLDRWAFSMKGSMRALMRVGFGSRNDGQPGTEMHSLPRIVGLGSGDWNYVGLAPNASTTLTVTVGSPLVSGSIMLGTSHLSDSSYPVVNDIGLDQAFLTFKFPSAFGSKGGISLTAGIFSERFGTAGPYQKSSGYYSTYLFGRTHQAGESLVINLDLSDKLELVLENGVGAKTEVVPFTDKTGGDRYIVDPNDTSPPPCPNTMPTSSVVCYGGLGTQFTSDDFPGMQNQPYGSTFVHHTHGALLYEDWLRLGAHYLVSWSPDDNTWADRGRGNRNALLTVAGGDVHLDRELYNIYLGYSHIDAKNLYPLADAVQVLHSGTGRALKLNYFGEKNRFTNMTPDNFSGTVDTLLWQFMLRVAPLLGDPFGSRDLNVAFYGMFNRAVSPKLDPTDLAQLDIRDNKLKFGADIDLSLLKFMSVGTRFDRVIPRLGNTDDAYTAISPRLSFYTKWKSKEQVILQYSHFFLGPRTVPGSPYTDGYYEPDPDLLVLMGRISF